MKQTVNKTPRRVSAKKTAGRPSGPVPAGSRGELAAAQARIVLLEEEVRKYRHRLAVFRQASLNLTLETSLNKTLNALAASAAEFFGSEAVSFMLWDEGERNLVVKAGYGLSDRYLAQCIPAEKIRPYLEVGQDYLVILDLKRTPVGEVSLIREEGLVSVLSVLLRQRDKVLGVLNVYSRGRMRNFTLEEIEHTRLFAQQAAIAATNVSLLAELKEEVQIAATLLQVAEDIGTLGSLEEVLTRIVHMITRALNFSLCTVFLWQKDRRIYLPIKAIGVPPHRAPMFDTLILHPSDLEFTPEELAQRQIISLDSAPKRFPMEKLAGVLGTRDLIMVPLVIKQYLLGAIVAGGYLGPGQLDAKGGLFLRGLAAQAAIAIDDAQLFERLEKAFWETIKTLTAAIEAKDHYTHDHSEAVIEYGTMMGEELGLSPIQKDMLHKACMLHDVGKIGIDDQILRKVDPLTPEEMQVIRKHPEIGEEILSSVQSLQEVSRIIRHHHEFYNGKGYPDGLAGEAIPLLSRILVIADSFDAMTSDRPYRKALSMEEAIAELRRHAGTQFDPDLVKLFLQALAKRELHATEKWP